MRDVTNLLSSFLDHSKMAPALDLQSKINKLYEKDLGKFKTDEAHKFESYFAKRQDTIWKDPFRVKAMLDGTLEQNPAFITGIRVDPLDPKHSPSMEDDSDSAGF